MKKLIQPLRLLVQACFMAGLFLPIFPFEDNIGQKIWITILFVGLFSADGYVHLEPCRIGSVG